MWMAAVAVLLVGCDKRPEAQVTPTTSTPQPQNSIPAKMVQKPQTELEQMFAAADALILWAKTPEELARIKPWRNVTLSPQPNGLKISALSRDPAVLLPEFRGRRAIIKIVIHSPANTALQLYYKLPGQKSYGLQSIEQKIKVGRNVVYAELLDMTTLIGPLRLDPGKLPGDYLLESFEAKAVSLERTP
jgi:hypothetical protein